MQHDQWTLSALRDTLLPKLMSGEVRMKEALTTKDITNTIQS